MIKNLFIGILHLEKDETWLKSSSKSGIQVAANNFQWNFISGLEQNFKTSPDIISTLSMGSFPFSSKKLFIRSSKHKRLKRATFKYIGYINFYVIKGLIRFIFLVIELFKWIRKNPSGNIYIYSLYTPFLFALFITRFFQNTNKVKTCLIVPDLFGKYGIQDSFFTLSGISHRIDAFFIKFLANKFDSYVLLTKQMVKPLCIKDKPFVVIEGLIDSTKIINNNHQKLKDSKKIVLYSGSLLKVFGINMLLESFNRLKDDNYELWICGPVNESKKVVEFTLKDNRIKYLGFLNKDELNDIRKESTLLINPRPNEGKYVKYSFPSKTMEYMKSGKPVLMFKLSGIPDEYFRYLYFFDENTHESICEKIIEILSKDYKELNAFGKNASNFIIKNKGNKDQVKKAVKLLESVKK